MKRRKEFYPTITTILLLALPFIGVAQDQKEGEKPAPQIITIEASKNAPTKSIADLLPDKLAGVKATSQPKEYRADNLNELAGDEATIYREYRVVAAASRVYLATIHVDIFQLDTPYSAFGLFTYEAGNHLAPAQKREIGSASATPPDALIFWQDNYLVRVKDFNQVNKRGSLQESIAAEIAKSIAPVDKAIELPTLLNSLPKNYLARSQRYFLGTESFNAYFERGRDLFSFAGDAEATVAEYQKPDANSNQMNQAKVSSKPLPGSTRAVPKPLKLAIVEYHTPQFATEADTRATTYLAALSEEEQRRIIVKRIGNFLVGATNFQDREFAEQLVNSIEYPYVVKWLQNPAIPTRDPFHEQKVAQIIMSSFGLVGLAGVIMMTGGLIVGTAVFLRRRKLNRESFSDAGGMLRLQLDPMENIILGLPPKRSSDER